MESWNGISLLWDLGLVKNDLQVYSDASGCAAVVTPHWLQLCWTPRLSIAIKELIPVVLAAASFGNQWAGKVVQFVVDNKAVVDVLNSTFCSDTHLMHLIRLLVFFAGKYNFGSQLFTFQGKGMYIQMPCPEITCHYSVHRLQKQIATLPSYQHPWCPWSLRI